MRTTSLLRSGFAIMLLMSITMVPMAPSIAQYYMADSLSSVKIALRNNSPLPHKVRLISYRPDETGNGTTMFWLLPSFSKSFTFPAGTRLYVANDAQVDTVMSGKRLNDTPFLVVKAEDDGGSFNIFK